MNDDVTGSSSCPVVQHGHDVLCGALCPAFSSGVEVVIDVETRLAPRVSWQHAPRERVEDSIPAAQRGRLALT